MSDYDFNILVYEPAIRQIIGRGLKRHAPEITRLADDEVMAYDFREGTQPTNRNYVYPFVSIGFNEEGVGAGHNPPPITKTVQVPSIDPANWAFDLLEISSYPFMIEFKVSVYEELHSAGSDGGLNENAWIDQRKLLDKVRNYFASYADEEVAAEVIGQSGNAAIDMDKGEWTGLYWAWVDPSTGALVADQDNPPATAVNLKFSLTRLGNVFSGTTMFNVARGERVRYFTITLAGVSSFVQRSPHIDVASVDIDTNPDSQIVETFNPKFTDTTPDIVIINGG